MDKYRRWKNAGERKGLSVNVGKTKATKFLFWKKSSVFRIWILVVSVVSRLVMILFSF